MRTEDDVRRALDIEHDHDALTRLTALADDLATGEWGELSAAPAAPPIRRRVLPALAAAAAVVLVVGGGLAVVGLRDGGGSGQAGGSRLTASERRPVWNLRFATVPGYAFDRVNASSIRLANGSTTFITANDADNPDHGVVTTCPGTLHYCADPGTPDEQVTIHGRPGYLFTGHDPHRVAVTFYGGHHTTVFLHGSFGSGHHPRASATESARRIVLRIASAISAGHRIATHLPFALSGLPKRVAPEQVHVQRAGACAGYGTGPRSVNDPLGIVFTACRVRTGATRAATIATADRADSNPENGPTRFEPEHPVVHDYADGTSLVIGIDRRRILSTEQARTIAARADVSPRLGDASTWFVVR